ncbi:MAG: hypothetical protein C4318_01230 [Acidimicrobiia bacterium]
MSEETKIARHSTDNVHGEGFLAEDGGRHWDLAAGDVAVCAPGIPHRHGARPGSDCVHVGIQSGEAEWLE